MTRRLTADAQAQRVHIEQSMEMPAARSGVLKRLVQGAVLGALLIAGLAWVSRRRAEREEAERE